MGRSISKVFYQILWTAVVAVISAYITKWVSDKSPDVVVRQYYNTVDTNASVPKQVGELMLDYQMTPSPVFGGVYLVRVTNKGNGAEENLRLQIMPAKEPLTLFYKEPNLKVFNPKEMTFTKGEFFTELENFPIDAIAEVAFVSPKDIEDLCNIDIKIAGKEKVGRVEGIQGVKCE